MNTSVPKQKCPRCETWNDMVHNCVVCGYDLSENVEQYKINLARAEFERRANSPENKARQKAINKMLRSHSKNKIGPVLEIIIAILSLLFGIYCFVANG